MRKKQMTDVQLYRLARRVMATSFATPLRAEFTSTPKSQRAFVENGAVAYGALIEWRESDPENRPYRVQCGHFDMRRTPYCRLHTVYHLKGDLDVDALPDLSEAAAARGGAGEWNDDGVLPYDPSGGILMDGGKERVEPAGAEVMVEKVVGPVIFALRVGAYSDVRVVGLFSSREKAEEGLAFLKKIYNDEYENTAVITPYTVDRIVSMAESGLYPYSVTLDAETGEVRYAYVNEGYVATDDAPIEDTSQIFTYRTASNVVTEVLFYATCYASTKQHAIKIARERWAIWKAQPRERLPARS